MSGRAKRGIYYAVTVLSLCAAIAACVLMAFSVYRDRGEVLYTLFSVLCALAVYILVSPAVLVHECGHLIFGACARLRPVSVTLGRFRVGGGKVRIVLPSVAGETVLLPKDGKNVRARMMAASLGGSLFNFLFGVVSAVLFFVVPAHPVLLFFALFAPLHLYEGIAAILPAELNTGRTDGELFRQLKLNTPEAQVFCNVLTVQGALQCETFDGVDEKLLFDTPVVREDDRAFLSLLHLRWQYLMWKGESERAGKELFRLEELSDYLDDETAAQVKCDALFMRRISGEAMDDDFQIPQEAKGTLEGLRAELALGRGDIAQYKKRTAQLSAAGLKALESTIFERFIQNF